MYPAPPVIRIFMRAAFLGFEACGASRNRGAVHTFGASCFAVLNGWPTLIWCCRQYPAYFTYFSAQVFSAARSSSVSFRATLAGEPRTIEPGGIFVPGVTRARAPIR